MDKYPPLPTPNMDGLADDSLDEDIEQFSLSISSSNQADIGATDTITVSIIDDDEPASTGGDNGCNSGNGGNGNANSDSGGGSSELLVLLVVPVVIARRVSLSSMLRLYAQQLQYIANLRHYGMASANLSTH